MALHYLGSDLLGDSLYLLSSCLIRYRLTSTEVFLGLLGPSSVGVFYLEC